MQFHHLCDYFDTTWLPSWLDRGALLNADAPIIIINFSFQSAMKQYAPENIVRNFEITCSMLFLVTHDENMALFNTIIAEHSITWLKTIFLQYLQNLQYRYTMPLP